MAAASPYQDYQQQSQDYHQPYPQGYHQDYHQQYYHAYHQHQHHAPHQQYASLQHASYQHQQPVELEAPHTMAFEMPATPLDAKPALQELPASHLDPKPSHAHLSVSASGSSPSTYSLPRKPCSVPLPLSGASSPLPSPGIGSPPSLTPDTSHASSPTDAADDDLLTPNTSYAPSPAHDADVNGPPLEDNYPQQPKPAAKLLGSKKAKKWLDRAVDGTQDRLAQAARPYVSNPRYNPKNWPTIAQAASHRYLEGKLYGPAGRFPPGEDVDVGLVGTLPARASVGGPEPEPLFPAVGLAPAGRG